MNLQYPAKSFLTFLNGGLICLRCARRLARRKEPQKRPFVRTLRPFHIAVVKDEGIDKKFFWANATRAKGSDESTTSAKSILSGGKFRKEDTLQPTTSQGASPMTGEPPHRRRNRLKTVALVGYEADTPLPPDASSTLSRSAAAAPARSWRRIISTYLALSKPRLAFLIVLTSTASYSIYPVPALLSTSVTDAPSLSTLTLLFLSSGTFSCIASANALNMLFESQHDAKMSRTRNRPLVRGLLSNRAAFIFAIATGIMGTGILWFGVNPTTALLGSGNIALYGFAYTFAKRIHPVNTWIGAIVGAIPPLMGWCAAASQYSTTAASAGTLDSIWIEFKELLFTEQAIGGWLIAALLFAWQFPHFFALSYGVRQEYAGAGYKMLTSSNMPMAARVSLRYSLAMFPICAGLSYYQVTDPAFVATSSVINAWMLKEAVRMWKLNGGKGSARALFWASVWQLPIALVLAMMQKKGLSDRVWGSIFPQRREEDEWEEEL